MPLLDKAASALEKIKRDDITNLRAYNTPPKTIDTVMQALCITIGEDEKVSWKPKAPGSIEKYQDFWEYSKKKVLDTNLIKRIQAFREDNIRKIQENKIKRLKELLQDPEMEESKVFTVSQPAGNLTVWIRAVVLTFDALLVVDPKRKQLIEAQEKLKSAEALLKEKKAALKEVLDLLTALEDDYKTAKKEKEDLEFQVDKCQKQLIRAEKLIKGLEGEKDSWGKKAISFREESKSITGDVMLSSGFVAYMGAFPMGYRKECLESWKVILDSIKVKYSLDFTLQKTLSDPITIGGWINNFKLPNDEFSIDNAIIMKNSSRFF